MCVLLRACVLVRVGVCVLVRVCVCVLVRVGVCVCERVYEGVVEWRGTHQLLVVPSEIH